jgi:ZIP family zinc transporter
MHASSCWCCLIASVPASLTYLGAPIAERFAIPHRVISAALQFAAGVITALVAFSLMPPALRNGATTWIVLAFFVGGVLFVAIEALSLHFLGSADNAAASPGFYIGILVDLLVDGVVIGIGATLTLMTGLLLALGMAISTAPLAFVATATAKRQGIAAHTPPAAGLPVHCGDCGRRSVRLWRAAQPAGGSAVGIDCAGIRLFDNHRHAKHDP